jgi:hypothetical protein
MGWTECYTAVAFGFVKEPRAASVLKHLSSSWPRRFAVQTELEQGPGGITRSKDGAGGRILVRTSTR